MGLARWLIALLAGTTALPAQAPPFTLLVMDPLCKRLACACVEGYAQRDYEVLGAFLQQRLGQPVRVVYGESLPAALRDKADGRVDLVVGKHSVVLFDAARADVAVTPLASLSGADGGTTQTGLLVVRGGDAAQQLADLRGYRVLFGPVEAEEKYSAALALLRQGGLPVAEQPETSPTCSKAAQALLELDAAVPAAAMLSSYARPLLEGCGTIDPGALRVVAQTAPVAFVAAFATDRVPAEELSVLRRALLAASGEAVLCSALQSRDGFVVYDAPVPAPTAWPGWRGRNRDGQVPWLPRRLGQRDVLWQRPMRHQGLAGLAADGSCVVVADRNEADTEDVWLCLDAESGAVRWTLHYEAIGSFDYGNSPRATPLLDHGRAFLLGAGGQLHCVDLASGRVLWQKDLAVAYLVDPPTWGYCASPLSVDGVLVVNPGAGDASWVGLDAGSGAERWRAAGDGAAYAAAVVGTCGGRQQLIAFDSKSLGGFDPQSGERLWRHVAPRKGDFHVPTPVLVDGMLALCSENNGTRLFRFAGDGRLQAQPFATFQDLAPDTTTPVVAAGRLFGNWEQLYCLDVGAGLRPVWAASDDAYGDHACLFASGDRVLFVSGKGELMLLDATAEAPKVLGRMGAFAEACEVYSHPALVGDRLYVRGSDAICCLRLSGG